MNSTNRPVLKDASQKDDMIDFYGSCDYDPTGKAAVQSQKMENQRRWSIEYSAKHSCRLFPLMDRSTGCSGLSAASSRCD